MNALDVIEPHLPAGARVVAFVGPTLTHSVDDVFRDYMLGRLPKKRPNQTVDVVAVPVTDITDWSALPPFPEDSRRRFSEITWAVAYVDEHCLEPT